MKLLGRPCPKRRAPRVRGKVCAHGAPEIPGLAERAPAITATSRGLGCAPICEPENADPHFSIKSMVKKRFSKLTTFQTLLSWGNVDMAVPLGLLTSVGSYRFDVAGSRIG